MLGHCRRAAPRRVAELGGMSAARKRKVELEEEEVGQGADAEEVQTLKEMFPAVPIRLIKVGWVFLLLLKYGKIRGLL